MNQQDEEAQFDEECDNLIKELVLFINEKEVSKKPLIVFAVLSYMTAKTAMLIFQMDSKEAKKHTINTIESIFEDFPNV